MRLVKTLIIAMGVMMAVGSWTAEAQDRSLTIGGPVLGFFPESDGGQIRPILGILGASLLGDTLDLQRPFYGAIVSPSQDYGLALDVEDGRAVLIRIANPISVTVLEGVATGADLLAISPTGAAAAIYQRELGVVQLMRGLPESPERTFDVHTAALPGIARDLAVSDDGTMALLRVSDPVGTSLWVVDSSEFWQPVPLIAPAAAAFLPNRQDVIVSDGATGEVVLLRDPTGVASRVSLLRPDGGKRTVTAVAASRDNQRVLIANREPAAVITVDMKTGVTETLACKCQPTGFHPLVGSGLFRLNDLMGDPLSVLDISSEESRIILIPPFR